MTDEERVVAKIAKAINRLMPKFAVQSSEYGANVGLVDIIVRLCGNCPRRLNALKHKEYTAVQPSPYVAVPVPPPPPTDATEEKK